MLAGLAWNLWRRALPAFADEMLATLGKAVVPLCLVLIGVSLAHYGIRGAVRGAVGLSLVKLSSSRWRCWLGPLVSASAACRSRSS